MQVWKPRGPKEVDVSEKQKAGQDGKNPVSWEVDGRSWGHKYETGVRSHSFSWATVRDLYCIVNTMKNQK